MSAEKTVNKILAKIRQTFGGLEDQEDAVKELHNLMSPIIRAYGEAMRREGVSQAQEGDSQVETKQPKPKRVTNYTMFGNWFREQPENAEIAAKEMFTHIGEAWGKVTDKVKKEWSAKAKEQNEKYKEEYIAEYGALPRKGKLRRRAKTTNGFQQYVADFRKDNPSVNHREVFQKASVKWNKMGAKQQKPYKDRAETLKAQYREEFEREKAENPELYEQMNAGKKKKNNEPRPSLRTGYILYGEHWRSTENKDKLVGKEAMTAIGAAWKKLGKAQKKKFNDQATEEKAESIATFLKEHPDSAWAEKHRKRLEKTSA